MKKRLRKKLKVGEFAEGRGPFRGPPFWCQECGERSGLKFSRQFEKWFCRICWRSLNVPS